MNTENSKKVLVIDNYDSFTFNLVHLLHECGQEVEVWRNDKFQMSEVEAFDKILLSPGPGLPQQAGSLLRLIQLYGESKSILGVCLGLQAIAEVYGGELENLSKPLHGVASGIDVIAPQEKLFQGIPARFSAARYHSWAVSKKNFPEDLQITATDDSGTIMAISHRRYKVKGVQFHPESVLSEYGKEIIVNWLSE